MKKTFFGHFVAGIDEHEAKPKVDLMFKYGVRSILCYSAEEDLKTEKANVKLEEATNKSNIVIKRKLYHAQEVQFEKNAHAFLESIEATYRKLLSRYWLEYYKQTVSDIFIFIILKMLRNKLAVVLLK